MQRLRVVSGDALWTALGAALSGGPPCATVAGADAAALRVLAPDVPVDEDDAGVVVVTSGSTGEPKAVVLGRPALRAATDALHERLGGPGAWTCALPVTFVAGLMTLVRSRYAGVEPRFARPDLSDLAPGPAREYISVVPTQLRRALGEPDVLARLRDYAAVVVGGAAMPPGLAQSVRAEGIALVTSYGMSETCGGCVFDGRPLTGVDVGADASGRLWIAGPMLFSGYRLRPDLTDEVLTDGRFLTSDRGEVDDSGRVRVVGRTDDVVISGGVNVDLAHLQRLLDAHVPVPVVALGVPDPEWGTRVVVATTGDITLDEVRSRLDVAPAAVPRDLRRFAAFPTTVNGKLDRQKLTAEWSVTDGDARPVD